MAGEIGGIIEAGVNSTLGLFNTIYGTYQDQRNYGFSREQFDYQKALNQKIMEREDTAVQRRVADLEAAGINKNLAAGTGATAQNLSTFGGSAGGQRVPGAQLDVLSHAYQVQQQKIQTEYMRKLLDKDLEQKDADIEATKSTTKLNEIAALLNDFEKDWKLDNGGANFKRMLEAVVYGNELDNSSRENRLSKEAYEKVLRSYDLDREQLRYIYDMFVGEDGADNFTKRLLRKDLEEKAASSLKTYEAEDYNLDKSANYLLKFLAILAGMMNSMK